MGAYLSRGTEAANEVPASKVESTIVVADVQKVTFADPPASVAKPSPQPAATGPLESVLKREGTARKSRAARTVIVTPAPASIDRPRRPSRAPRVPAAAAVPALEVVTATDAAVAVPGAVAAAARRAAKRAAKKTAAKKKAPAAAVAAPAPELVVVGKAMRQKGAVPARKVGMKRVAKRALKPVAGAATSRAPRSKK